MNYIPIIFLTFPTCYGLDLIPFQNFPLRRNRVDKYSLSLLRVNGLYFREILLVCSELSSCFPLLLVNIASPLKTIIVPQLTQLVISASTGRPSLAKQFKPNWNPNKFFWGFYCIFSCNKYQNLSIECVHNIKCQWNSKKVIILKFSSIYFKTFF